MPTKNCPSCSNHDFLNGVTDNFGSKLAKLLQDSLEEIKLHRFEGAPPEVIGRKDSFPIELADHLLWLAASIYVEEDSPASEAIYELARAFEEVCSEEAGVNLEPTQNHPPDVN
jgi:hypothetical protein